MPIRPNISNAAATALSKLFYEKNISDLVFYRERSKWHNIILECGYSGEDTVFDVLSSLYGFFEKEYQSEYYYKNELVNQIIIPNKKLNNTSIATELRAGGSKADVVTFTDKSVAYEIKTPFDSFLRLGKQVDDYCKLFDEVYVVLAEQYIKSAENMLSENIGIIYMDGSNKLIKHREAKSNLNSFCLNQVMKSIRKVDYLQLVCNVYGKVPNVSNMFIYNECKRLILDLPKETVRKHFVSIQRKRFLSIPYSDFDSIPYELRTLALTSNNYLEISLKLNNKLSFKNATT